MIRKLFKLAVFLLIANAVYQVAPVSLRYYRFKDAVHQIALFSQKSTQAELVDAVLALAYENNVPLEREYVQVQRRGAALYITATYVETMRFFPGSSYTREIEVATHAAR
jgi:hypothetical protein